MEASASVKDVARHGNVMNDAEIESKIGNGCEGAITAIIIMLLIIVCVKVLVFG